MLDASPLDGGLTKRTRSPIRRHIEVETVLSHANKHHGVLKAARLKPALGNLKAVSFAENKILLGDPDIFKHQFALRLGAGSDGPTRDSTSP